MLHSSKNGRNPYPGFLFALPNRAELGISYGMCAVVLAFLAFDRDGLFAYFLGSMLLHECGHLIAITLSDLEVTSVRAELSGACIRYGGGLRTYLRDALIAAAGPAASLIAALAALAANLSCGGNSVLEVLIGTNLMFCMANLIPAFPADGGRIAFSLLAAGFTPRFASMVLRVLTAVCGMAAALCGIYVLIRTGYNLSLAATGIFLLSGINQIDENVR